MGWVKLDDAMPHHPKTMRVGAEGFALDVAAIAYSNRFDADGFIADADLPAVLPCLKSPKKWAQKLVEAARWERDDSRGGWHIHDIHDYQPTAAESRADKESARERMRTLRANRKGSSGDVRANTDECSPDVRNPVPSRPVPTDSLKESSTHLSLVIPSLVDDETIWPLVADAYVAQKRTMSAYVDKPPGYFVTMRNNAAADHGIEADRLHATFVLTPQQIGACLAGARECLKYANRREGAA